jgi:hypothetical protein
VRVLGAESRAAVTKPTGNPAGRPRLGAGEDSVRVITWMPASLRRKMAYRREQLGMAESEYLRRLVENACLGVPTGATDEV